MTWRRHTASGDSKFHAGAPSSGSFVTFCRGRWPLTDEERQGAVEHKPSPPHELRCDACQRQVIEVRRVDVGLRELAAAPHDWPGINELFDHGGEA